NDSQDLGCFDVAYPVVDEQSFTWWNAERGETPPINGQIGFDGARLAGKREAVEVAQPRKVPSSMTGHVRLHVGEQCGPESGAVNGSQPLDHLGVDGAPHLKIPLAELADHRMVDFHARRFGELTPVVVGTDITAVVGIPAGNVSREELDRKSTRLNSSHVSISYAVS